MTTAVRFDGEFAESKYRELRGAQGVAGSALISCTLWPCHMLETVITSLPQQVSVQ